MATTISKADLKRLGIDRKTARKASGRMANASYQHERGEACFFVPLEPKTKSRARTFVTETGTRTRTPKSTKDFEAAVAQIASLEMRGNAPFSCPVRVEAVFVISGDENELPVSTIDGDLDNHLKAILDAMNHVVFADDKLVVEITAAKICGPKAGMHIRVRPYIPSLSLMSLTAWART